MTNPTPRILLVDDEPAVLDVQRLALEMNGFVCSTAANGLEALKALCQAPFDAVVSDIRMPSMSGFELLPIIRRQYPELLVIVCSAEPEDKLESLDLLMDAYLQKGAYTSERLVGTLEQALQLHRSLLKVPGRKGTQHVAESARGKR